MRFTTPILPPRKRDWKPGDVQFGLFIRFDTGATIEFSINDAPTDEIKAALALVMLAMRPDADRSLAKLAGSWP